MQDFSLVDKFKILMNVIVSSPLYIGVIVSLILFLIVVLFSKIRKQTINKWVYIGVWILFFIVLLAIYHKFVIELFDNLFDTVFMTLYFPNLSIYIIILLVSNIFFIYSILNRSINKVFKILNISSTIIIDLLMFFIVGIISKNNINVYEELTVYTNSSLLVLLELTTGVFAAWLSVNVLISLFFRLREYDFDAVNEKVRKPKKTMNRKTKNKITENTKEDNGKSGPEIIFDWIKS